MEENLFGGYIVCLDFDCSCTETVLIPKKKSSNLCHKIHVVRIYDPFR